MPTSQPHPRHPPHRGLIALALAALLWLPNAHRLFHRDTGGLLGSRDVSPYARKLAAWHLHLWSDPITRQHEVERMRRSNAEWDFMGRTYLVLSLANLALRDPGERARALAVIDTVLEETLRLEATHGFLLTWFTFLALAPTFLLAALLLALWEQLSPS